jgi:GNAT superfamily N-acetyltransferase
MNFEIRSAIKSDAMKLGELITELGYPSQAKEVWARIEKMPPETYETLVAVLDGDIAGFIGLLTLPVYEHSHPIGWVLALCVSPHRQRQGIGTALIQAAEAHYREKGVIDVRLHSGLQREDAHDFYEKRGFAKSGYRFKKKLS